MGAGTAGTTAAILLARHGQQVILVESAPRLTRKNHAPDWLCAPGVELLDELGIDCAAKLGEPFEGLTFHSPDLAKTAHSPAKNPPAYRINYPQLVSQLHQIAREAGVEIVHEAAARRIDVGEGKVCVELGDTDPLEAAFLLLADGAGRTLCGGSADTTILTPVPPATTGRWFATLELPAATRGKDARDGHLHWLLGLDRHRSCLLWWSDGSTIVLSLFAPGTGTTVAQKLCQNAARLLETGLIASKQPLDPAAVVLRPAPARSALEIDTHVTKRCLLIGDAGGFISETSGSGIYAGAWSARLGAESLITAADSPHPQDQLRQFSTTWRCTMADYLRPPNTDVHFLLPLIFSNQQMADRMAAAFWQGQNI